MKAGQRASNDWWKASGWIADLLIARTIHGPIASPRARTPHKCTRGDNAPRSCCLGGQLDGLQ